MTSFRILITGSRTWQDEQTIADAIFDAHCKMNPHMWPITIVHGAARGADLMADAYARKYHLRIEAHPADWDTHGKRAGFIRNQEMVDLGADVCLAFIRDNSKGATMTAELAEKAHIPTIIYREDSA